MTLNEQKVNPDPNSEADGSIPELPHPPGTVEPSSPTSTGSTPEPHFSAPGHLDPPV